MGYLSEEASTYGGTPHRKETSVALVTIWEIPNGCDYHAAKNLTFFFDDKEKAAEFERRNSHPPECPWLFSLSRPEIDKLYPMIEYGEHGTNCIN